ncbi:acetylserotonin O-methyltransferase isoform X2 [Pseudorasbora parva]|uniref:acetylserotonin O-methyltransferase isoform X2 n=1 Tax=Pseudorasbora parva TaxID=51549 RepID=UPI00351F1527
MATADEELYPRKILEYMEGFLVSKTLFSACELGVFELLNASPQPMSAAQIAQTLSTSEDGTERLLSACVGLELLTAHTHTDGAVLYSNTEMSRVFLTKSSPKSLYHSIEYSSRTIYLCWHYLTDAVRSDEEMVKFMQLMNSIWNICGRDVITAFDLSPFRRVCDLGGCSGALAKQCVSAYPESTVTIFDLPKVVRTSRQHFVTEQDERISFCEGDFFKDALPPADLYILARILHDWTDQRSVELLVKIYQSCRAGGGVLLVEALLHEDESGPLTAQLYSLNMLVQTEGRERKGSDYTRLLSAAGFTRIQIHTTGKIYDAILACK